MSFGNQSQLGPLYRALMTDDYGPLVECEVLGEKFTSVPKSHIFVIGEKPATDCRTHGDWLPVCLLMS